MPQNKEDILIGAANISSVYEEAILLNKANDSEECNFLIEYRISDVRKERVDGARHRNSVSEL